MKYHIVIEKSNVLTLCYSGTKDECNEKFVKMSNNFGKSMAHLLTVGGYSIVSEDDYLTMALKSNSEELLSAAKNLYNACGYINLSDDADQAMHQLFDVLQKIGRI